MIKLLLFDADGVLFQSNRAISEHLQKKFKLSGDKDKQVWNTLYKKLSAGGHSTKKFIELFAKEHGIPEGELMMEDFTEPYAKTLVPIPGIENLLDRISENKVKKALLSDTSEMLHAQRKSKPIFKHFDKLFLSYETGHMKPNEQAFQNVIHHYKLEPGEIFFIDDSPQHVEAAKRLGIQGIVFQNTQHLTETLERLAII